MRREYGPKQVPSSPADNWDQISSSILLTPGAATFLSEPPVLGKPHQIAGTAQPPTNLFSGKHFAAIQTGLEMFYHN